MYHLQELIRHENISEKYPGFFVFGDEEKATRRIVVLGGSTSDAGMYENLVKSWPEYLAEKFDNVVIYDGAISGYDSIRECLKLLSDVTQLKPDLIISYSGGNDVLRPGIEGYPFTRRNMSRHCSTDCLGVRNDICKSDNWIMMERYMKAMAEINGSDFLAILHPVLCTKKQEALSSTEWRTITLCDKEADIIKVYPEFAKEVKEKMRQYSWMYDLTDAFDDVQESVYRDTVHLNDLGNQIVADKIYSFINKNYLR